MNEIGSELSGSKIVGVAVAVMCLYCFFGLAILGFVEVVAAVWGWSR